MRTTGGQLGPRIERLGPIGVLAHPDRKAIVKLLIPREMSVEEVARHFNCSRPNISIHLRILLDAHFLTVTKKGTSRYYRTDVEEVQTAVDQLMRDLGLEDWYG